MTTFCLSSYCDNHSRSQENYKYRTRAAHPLRVCVCTFCCTHAQYTLSIQYTVAVRRYGVRDDRGEWTGLIGMLVRQATRISCTQIIS
jgi:hypothetical protein